MFCFIAFFLTDVSYLGTTNAKGVGFTPDCHVIFHVIWFFNSNGDVVKNNWWWMFRKCSEKRLWQSLFQWNCKSVLYKLLLRPEFTEDSFQNMSQKTIFRTPTKMLYPRGFCNITPYKNSEKFLQDIFTILYLSDLQPSNL